MMAEGSAHNLSYVEEATRGTTPTNPRFRRLPDTRTTLAKSKETLQSERSSGDRFPTAPRSGASAVGGDIPADLSIKTYDDFIASALQGEWVESGVGEDTADIEIDTVASAGVAVGDTFTTTNGVVTIETINAKDGEMVLTWLEGGEDAPETYEIIGLSSATIDGEVFEVTAYTDVEESATVLAGEARKSFSILREFSDLEAGAEPFLLYVGCEVASWNLTASANGIAKSSFTFWGRDMEDPSLTEPAGTSYSPAYATEPFDTFSGDLKIDGVEECIVTDYNFTVSNGHAPKYTIGCAASNDASVGKSVIEGSITAFFENMTLYKKYLAEESLAIELTLSDSEGNQLIVNLPNLKIGNGTQPDVGGDGAVSIPINFTAHYDKTLGSHISVKRVIPVSV